MRAITRTRARTTSGLALLLGLAGAGLRIAPASAACADDIAAFEKQVDATSHRAVAASTGGQADAAARGSQAEAVKKGGAGAKTVPAPDGSDATEDTAKAASGGEAAVKAKVILNDAKSALDRGDEHACHESLMRAKDQLKG